MLVRFPEKLKSFRDKIWSTMQLKFGKSASITPAVLSSLCRSIFLTSKITRSQLPRLPNLWVYASNPHYRSWVPTQCNKTCVVFALSIMFIVLPPLEDYAVMILFTKLLSCWVKSGGMPSILILYVGEWYMMFNKSTWHSSLYVCPRSSSCLDTWNVFAVKIENVWAGAHASGDPMKFIRQKKLLLRIGIQCRVKARTVPLGNGLEERQSRMTARTWIGVTESNFERHPASGSRSTFLRRNIQRYISLATMYSQYLFPLS